jgi:uncharacterized protein
MLIDIHAHVVPNRSVTWQDGSTYPLPEQLLAKLDGAGIDKAVLLPIPSPEGNHRIVSTEDVLEVAAAYPERFIPFCNIDPRQIWNSSASDFSAHLRYYKSAGCKGVGELTSNLPFDDPLVDNLFAYCEVAEMPVLFHIGPQIGGCYGLVDSQGIPKLERALKKFPKLTFIGHSQPFWAHISADVTEEGRSGYPAGKIIPGRVPELMRKYDNLYGDLSAKSGFNALNRDPEYGYRFMEEFQDRLLFGTDISSPATETP